jgi:hypothetical protein
MVPKKFLLITTLTLQKLAKSEEEDVVGNYFKPHRASRLVAQAKETQRSKKKVYLFLFFFI